ncbi:MAG TPA: YSC84-related protein [Phycisphaerae bacterium]|nr:YSC84-related protein [Phycisphaerae bacterium]
MLRKTMILPATMLVGLLLAGCHSEPTGEEQKLEMKQDVRDVAQATLQRLYAVQPSAKAAVENSVGYAVFNNFGMKIFVAGSGMGEGIAINNKTKEETFMRMAELQAGLGMGVKKFSLVWVFETQEAMDRFVNKGWEIGGQTSAAASTGSQGGALQGAMPIAPDVWLYQMTDAGLALELTAKGTKYYKDEGLN